MLLCGQRYYDSLAGRWTQCDPIGTAGGLNVYGYCGNNPTNFVDPSGLMSPRQAMTWLGVEAGVVHDVNGDPNESPCPSNGDGDDVWRMIDKHQQAGQEAGVRGFNMVGTAANGLAAVVPGAEGAEALEEAGALGAAERGATSVVEHTGDQTALKEIAREASRGGKTVSKDDANTLLDWAAETGYPGARAKPGDLSDPKWGPHIHLPGSGPRHIPVEPGVAPRVFPGDKTGR